jgi:hemolysin activation/secretion protein
VKQRIRFVAGVLLLGVAIGWWGVPVFAADPPSPPQSPPPAAAMPAAATPAEKPFAVHEYRVLGNTVLSNRQIEGVLYPRLGDAKTFPDVESARAALEDAYHSLGFATVFVDIPPQEVTDGIVRLKVTEGRLRNRTITGARYFSEGKILEALPATTPGTVPNINVLQQQLNAVNTQTADRSVVPVLKAGEDPGTMDLALKVDDHLPLHGSLDLNNQYTADTESLRGTVALSYNNLFNELDSIGAQYTFTPQHTGQVSIVNANYGFRPIGDGIRPSLSFTNSSSNVATLGTLGVLGDGQVYGGRVAVPLLQLPGDMQSVTLGLDYKHFRNTISLDSSGATPHAITTIQPISYVNASIAYNGAWQRLVSGVPQQTGSFDVTFNGGPRGLANATENFGATRFMARGNYAYLRSDGSFTTRLPAGVLLTVRASGQAAQDPLVEYEQYSITGSDGVRGYLEAEVLSDSAVKGTLQLQSPPVSTRKFLVGDGFLFFDAGRSHAIDALPGEQEHISLRSFGAGLDLFPGHWYTGTLTIADPLLPGPRTKSHEPRVLFDVKGAF